MLLPSKNANVRDAHARVCFYHWQQQGHGAPAP
jgi:hypothetical protein